MSDRIEYVPTEAELKAAAGAIWSYQVRLPITFAQPDQQELFLKLAAVALVAAHDATSSPPSPTAPHDEEADLACECEMGWQCDFCRQFARGYNGHRSVERGRTNATMVDPCPDCGEAVVAKTESARTHASEPWSHATCYDARAEAVNPHG